MKIKSLIILLSLLIASCSTPRSPVVVVTATPPPTSSASPTPSQITLWVCADLAYGYESEQSRVVWRMSKRDGWMFTGPSLSSAWIPITIEDGRSTYMRRVDLCDIPPTSAGATPQASDCPKGCQIPPPGCRIKVGLTQESF